MRITSACAEQTHAIICRDITGTGSPPRVRSRPGRTVADARQTGITSACAEQTVSLWKPTPKPGDHLRVCGADFSHSFRRLPHRGSPPRVRSRRGRRTEGARGTGITSACAEQTTCYADKHANVRDHLRVCGADDDEDKNGTSKEGSPPRVRSRRDGATVEREGGGITSACAEQTTMCPSCPPWTRDHLRVCGADATHARNPAARPWDHLRVCGADDPMDAVMLLQGNHLRVCGADDNPYCGGTVYSGSPPRVRSRPAGHPAQRGRPGITSACAEQTASAACLTR